jgi:hypothetical protein
LNSTFCFFHRQLEVGAGDAVAVVQAFLAERTGDIEKDAAADHLVLGFLNAAFLRAERRHFAAVVAVPHVVLIKHVTEAVPLRAALQRHHHHVVGGADAALIERAGIGVRAGAQHRVQRIDAAERRIRGLAALRAVIIEIERERDHLALFHELRCGDDVFGLRVIERADLIIGTPFAPVLIFFRGLVEIVSRHFAPGHWLSLPLFAVRWI